MFKRSKKDRMRAKTTHGGGSKKKRRGAGSRGGRGMAGSGKRAATKKPSIIKNYGLHNYFGRHGFKSRYKSVRYLNIGDLNSLVLKGKVEQEGDHYLVDLKKLGYGKLLGKGVPEHQFHVSGKCTDQAKFKIEKAKGQVGSIKIAKPKKEVK